MPANDDCSTPSLRFKACNDHINYRQNGIKSVHQYQAIHSGGNHMLQNIIGDTEHNEQHASPQDL
jgi:hypothetical protein